MSRREFSASRDVDWIIILLYLFLILVGSVMIYSANYSEENPSLFNFDTQHGKQLIFICVALGLGLFAYVIDIKFYRAFAYVIYGGSLALLIGVLIFGAEISGSRSWFQIGGFSLQPSEFAKFGTAIALAAFLSNHNIDLSKSLSKLPQILGIICFPMFLILLQGDAGSASVFMAFFIVLYRQGMPQIFYLIGGILIALTISSLMLDNTFPLLIVLAVMGIIFLVMNLREHRLRWLAFPIGTTILSILWGVMEPSFLPYILGVNCLFLLCFAVWLYIQKKKKLSIFIVISLLFAGGYTYSVNYAFYKILKPYQQDRILVWLRPQKCDPLGSYYNVRQSKLAIGSGGFSGKGFGKGTLTKLDYVPEQSTDFIFCTVGEEQGFVGTTLLILCYLLLMIRIVAVAERQRSTFNRLYAYGIASILFIHFLINIGMTMGVMPVIGIPLPLISYGGSSLIAFTLMIAVLIKLDSQRLFVFR